MDCLLKGRYRDPAEIESALSHAGWNVSGQSYAVMIIRIVGHNAQVNSEILIELDYLKAYIEDCLNAITATEVYLHYIDQRKFAVLLCSDTINQQDFIHEQEAVIRNLLDKLSDNYAIKAYCAIGDRCGSLLSVCDSYDKASQASDYQAIKEEGNIVWYSSLPHESIRYYYPIDLEERLIYSTKVGDKQAVKKIINNIKQENFERRTLSVEVIQQLLNELRGTVDKILDDRVPDEARQLYRDELINSKSIDGFFYNLNEILMIICEKVNQSDKRDRKSLVSMIENFVRLNFGDANLCLATTAAHFKLSPAYFSQLFKDEAGENFSEYLERIRMERACELLADRRLPIGDIASQLGYTSDKVFRRAFKRVRGVSPTAYRETIL